MNQDLPPIEAKARGRLYYDKKAKMIRGTRTPAPGAPLAKAIVLGTPTRVTRDDPRDALAGALEECLNAMRLLSVATFLIPARDQQAAFKAHTKARALLVTAQDCLEVMRRTAGVTP